jgi:hypothetical protein
MAYILYFDYSEDQRTLFKTGMLWKTWIQKYPEIFDIDDERLANKQAKYNYHFFEWLAAILMYNSTGYLSLVEKYQFNNHKLKQQIIKRLLPQSMLDLMTKNNSREKSQFPDLLLYKPDFSDWFFCEAKGPHDRIRTNQKNLFQYIEMISQKEICIINFIRK